MPRCTKSSSSTQREDGQPRSCAQGESSTSLSGLHLFALLVPRFLGSLVPWFLGSLVFLVPWFSWFLGSLRCWIQDVWFLIPICILVLQQMREVAERKKNMEKEHAESVSSLRTAQAQLGLLGNSKNADVERAQHSQNIESLQVRHVPVTALRPISLHTNSKCSPRKRPLESLWLSPVSIRALPPHLIQFHHISSHCITLHHIASHCITLHHISLYLIVSFVSSYFIAFCRRDIRLEAGTSETVFELQCDLSIILS